MNRIDYQKEISDMLDDALNNLNTEEFNTLIERIKEIIEDYN